MEINRVHMYKILDLHIYDSLFIYSFAFSPDIWRNPRKLETEEDIDPRERKCCMSLYEFPFRPRKDDKIVFLVHKKKI